MTRKHFRTTPVAAQKSARGSMPSSTAYTGTSSRKNRLSQLKTEMNGPQCSGKCSDHPRPSYPMMLWALAGAVSIAIVLCVSLGLCDLGGTLLSSAPVHNSCDSCDPHSTNNPTTKENSQAENISDGHAGAHNDTTSATTPRAAQELSNLRQQLEKRLDPYGDAVALAVVDVDSGDCCKLHADKAFVSASMIKLTILAAYSQALDQKRIDPCARVRLRDMHVVGGTGKIQSEQHRSYSYDELCRYMIMYSDNTASNALIDALGIQTINTCAQELGCTRTVLNRKFMQLNTGIENWTSANDMATLLRAFAQKHAASTEACEQALNYLSQQTDDEGLTQGITSGHFAHKTGSLNTIRHDGGIVMCAHPYVLVVLSDIGAGHANKLMAQIAADVDTYMNKR